LCICSQGFFTESVFYIPAPVRREIDFSTGTTMAVCVLKVFWREKVEYSAGSIEVAQKRLKPTNQRRPPVLLAAFLCRCTDKKPDKSDSHTRAENETLSALVIGYAR